MISGCTESLDQESFVCIKGRDIVVFNLETGDELVVFPNVIRQIYTEQIHSLGLIRTGVAFLFKQNQCSASFDLIRIVGGGIKGIKLCVALLNLFISCFSIITLPGQLLLSIQDSKYLCFPCDWRGAAGHYQVRGRGPHIHRCVSHRL